MSDEVAKAGSEDVLSSIRRLVSDEGTVRSIAARKAAEDDKLVLTPALRVASAEEDGGAEAAAPEASEEAGGSEAPPVASALESTVAELESAVGGHADFEPDGGENSTVLDYPPSLLREVRDPADQPLPGPRRRLTLGLSEPQEADAGDAADAAPAPPPPERPGTLRLVSPVSEPEPLDEAPVAQAPTAAAPLPQSIDDIDEVEEVVLDEDALREVVAEIVREELRGNLGEQITSNIRKLIRREIHDYFDVTDNE